MIQTDLIIIGSGPGGYEMASKAAEAGLKVTIVEANKLGGTCLNVGCIPTKSYYRDAEVYRTINNASTFGFSNVSYDFDFSKIVERKNGVVDALVSGVATLLSKPGIVVVEGKAQLKNSTTIIVNGKEYQAKNIVIATGSIAKYLPIEGAKSKHVVTSTELLNLTTLPKHLCVIGGGVIGLEFATIFHSFGCEVTVLEYCKNILPNFDEDISKRLKQLLKRSGINVITSAQVTAIDEGKEATSKVRYNFKNKEQKVEADTILMAVSRAANTGALNLDDLSIAYDRRGIKVNENMQTNIPNIYAVGDINGLCQLAHAATFQSFHALNHILGKTDTINCNIMPAAVFTHPEIATVGLTTQQCKEKGITVNAHKSMYRSNGKAISMDETDGLVKILTDENDIIVGCHIIGTNAADLIQEITALMTKKTTLTELGNIIHPHPTLSEIILHAARS